MKTTREEKINFILENFPDVHKTNPYRDYSFVKKVKEKMVSSGMYASSYESSNPAMDASILKLLDHCKKLKSNSIRNS